MATKTTEESIEELVHKSKRIEFRYKPEQIGQKTIDRVCRYYTQGTQLSDIVRIINAPRTCDNTLNLADVYTILNKAAHEKKVKQRRKFTEFELLINDFVLVYRAWKKGIKKPDIINSVPGCKVGIERALNSMNTRYREHRAKIEISGEYSAREILSKAFLTFINGQKAYVIYQKDIPEDALKSGIELPEGDEMIIDLSDVSTGNRALNEAGELTCAVPLQQGQELVRIEPQSDFPEPPPHQLPPNYIPEGRIQSEEEVLDDPVFDAAEQAVSEIDPDELKTSKPVQEQLDNLLG